MDADTLNLLMYLDEGLVKNLSSLLLSGYIEIRTTKLTQDRTLAGHAGYDSKDFNFGENRCYEEKRDGFKLETETNIAQCNNASALNGYLDNKEFVRREEELKTIYTTFSLHNQILTSLSSEAAVKIFDNNTITEGAVSEGEYVKIHGKLTTENINSYLDSLLTVFNCFGCDTLDKMVSTKNEGIINFTNMNAILNHLNDILNKNSTEDMILTCGNTPVVVNVNDNFFMNNNSYIFDKVDCPCTVFGKVIKVAPCGDCVSLLRKTAQNNFYEQILNKCSTYCELLSSNGIILPEMPRLKCEGISLVVVPVSICM